MTRSSLLVGTSDGTRLIGQRWSAAGHRAGRGRARPRDGRALAALRPARPGAGGGRDRPAGRRPARPRAHRGDGGRAAGRPRTGRLERAGRRLRAGRAQHPQGAAGDPDRGARAQHGFLGGAAVPAGALGRRGRRGALRHRRAGAGAGRRRPEPGAGPDRVQRALPAAHRVRVAQSRRRRGGPVRGRADVRFRPRPGRRARDGRRRAQAGRHLGPAGRAAAVRAGRQRRPGERRRGRPGPAAGPLPGRRSGRDAAPLRGRPPRDVQRDQPGRGGRRPHQLAGRERCPTRRT